jgi:hypothetical protein
MIGTSHFWSRSRFWREKNFGSGTGPGEKNFWSRSRREKFLGLGSGPFRNKFWCRSQSKIFWSWPRSRKKILAPVPVKKRNLVPVPVPAGPGPLCPSLIVIVGDGTSKLERLEPQLILKRSAAPSAGKTVFLITNADLN